METEAEMPFSLPLIAFFKPASSSFPVMGGANGFGKTIDLSVVS